MPRPRKEPLSALAKELRGRAQSGTKTSNDSLTQLLRLPSVADPGGPDPDNRRAIAEALLVRAVREIEQRGGESSDDATRRARVAEALFALNPLWRGRDFTARRQEICRRYGMNLDSFRQGYELDTYERMADAIRSIDAEYREVTGRSPRAEDERSVLTKEVLHSFAVPLAALGVHLGHIIAAAGMPEAVRAAESDEDHALLDQLEPEAIAEVEAEADAFTTSLAEVMRVGSLAPALLSFGMFLLRFHEHHWTIADWRESDSGLAFHCASALAGVVQASPFEVLDSAASQLRIAARDPEPAAFQHFIASDEGAAILASWTEWAQCRCALSETADVQQSDPFCGLHNMLNAADEAYRCIDLEVLSPAELGEVAELLRPRTALDYMSGE